MNDIERTYQEWLNSSKVSEKDKKTLKNMSEDEKADAFFKDVEFGTAGMRGVLGPGTNRLNEFTIRKASVGFAMYVLEKYPNAKTDGIVISYDNRHYSKEFTLLSAKVFNTFGIKAYIFDALRPTPELSFAVRYKKACGGIMITASHNPREYNGYKVYDEQGCQLVPGKIQRLLEIMDTLPKAIDVELPKTTEMGVLETLGPDVDDVYCDLVMKTQINPNLDKKGFKIVYTPQHGTSYENAMRIFKELGYEIYPVLKQCTHDPDFSGTLSPNPEEPKAYIEPIKEAKKIGAQLICMTDPDGDRVGLAALDSDGEYKLITGNQSAAMLIDYIFSQRKQRNELAKNGVMYSTIVSSALGKKVAASYGVKTEEFLTGFKFIGDRIHHYEELGNGPTFEFGYEESYGCLVKPFVRDKDGLQAILLYSEMALYHYLHGKNLLQVFDELQERFGYYSDVTYSKMFTGPKGQADMNALMDKLHDNLPLIIGKRKVVKYEDYLKQKGFVVDGETYDIELPKSNVVKIYFDDDCTVTVRPSGTEPKCKFYVGAVANNKKDSQTASKEIYSDLASILNLN